MFLEVVWIIIQLRFLQMCVSSDLLVTSIEFKVWQNEQNSCCYKLNGIKDNTEHRHLYHSNLVRYVDDVWTQKSSLITDKLQCGHSVSQTSFEKQIWFACSLNIAWNAGIIIDALIQYHIIHLSETGPCYFPAASHIPVCNWQILVANSY